MTSIHRLAWLLLAAAGCGGSASSALSLDGAVRVRGDAIAEGFVHVQLGGTSEVVVVPSAPEAPPTVQSLGIVQPPPGLSSASVTELDLAPGRTSFGVDARDGRAWLEDTTVALGDLHLEGGSLPPGGVELRDLVLAIDSRRSASPEMTVVRAESDLLSLMATRAFELRWKLELEDGTLHTLGPLALEALEVHASVERDAAGHPGLELVLLCPGECGGVPGVFSLTGGVVDVRLPVTLSSP
jgi:hypothetical protein